MPSIEITTILQMLGSVIAGLGAYKMLWPSMSRMLESHHTRSQAEDHLLKQALARADAAEARADEYFEGMAEMKSQIALLTYQLKISTEHIETMGVDLREAREQVAALTRQITILTGGKDA